MARDVPMPAPARTPDLEAAMRELQSLDLPDQAARQYFEKHLPRLARTLSLTPRPRTSGRILELGCYMQLTPFLQRWKGYREVRGAYHGVLGETRLGSASVGGEPFQCNIDLFDAERDRFPYNDDWFETALACEMIEHLLRDPMHFLLECRRILEEGGRLIITTPNVASLTSVARALHGYDNPQLYSQYQIPRMDAPTDPPHVREYTAFELRDLLESAGFEIESLFTEPIAALAMNLPIWNFLEEHGYNTSMRGEQTYCVAVKRSALPVTRYPKFLYVE
ncbi:MAG TPA: methyltransferase domain-containing protein [Bryobacteraceae bacterium]|nr:methyltransferase domain-containing protein [Bryobacteraceae bacterium]